MTLDEHILEAFEAEGAALIADCQRARDALREVDTEALAIDTPELIALVLAIDRLRVFNDKFERYLKRGAHLAH